MTGFALTAPNRTIFGRDCRVTTADEIARIGSRVLLVRGRSVSWVDELAAELTRLGGSLKIVCSAGEPDLDDVRDAVAIARDHRAECIVSVGGGAIIDLGKAVAGLCVSEGDPAEYLEQGNASPRQLNEPLPFIAMPTTAGTGAEATRNAVIGVPELEAKISLRDPRLVPDLAIVDPALTDGSPKSLTLASGLDAITQFIESYLCNRANPVTDALCEANIRPAMAALHRLMEGEDPQARDTMARASFLSGIALANSGLGIIHGLASVIGGRGAPHGAICGRLLAPGLTVNAEALTRLSADTVRFDKVNGWLADGLGDPGGSGASALHCFIESKGLPSLCDLGIAESEFDSIAKLSAYASSTKANPVALEHADICRILQIA
ncbi:alcohol dehydrogenase [Aliiroseovarius zhejiangensis]|uniref:Alcohol dehydrogenase n=1 Tax=Aliiroseovarius zhejiangensis TaxID=1632025 RepID=A0ABQ3ITT5_9RHOB|nr:MULTISPECIES: iron-containing alcohol dehydrogenase [Rhodobacterales]MDE9452074.1 iron-containing alcohol dehydrogenase [Aliiroseovarius sp. Z3]GHE89111.1 alcohol dehydrogenase [Aliiroseovarius zhejiangensis]